MLKVFSKFIAIIFHPLLIVTYALLILLWVNPYLFSFQDTKSQGLIVILIFMLSFGFPLISIVMMKLVGFISTLEMPDAKERIIPLAITTAFYMWLFINIKSNSLIPVALRMFILGATISITLAFLINLFTKISLHTVGMGGYVMITVLIKFLYSYETFYLSIPLLGGFMVSMNLVIIISLVLAGLVGTTRLHLKAHELQDIYGGYIVGVLGQLIAFRILG